MRLDLTLTAWSHSSDEVVAGAIAALVGEVVVANVAAGGDGLW